MHLAMASFPVITIWMVTMLIQDWRTMLSVITLVFLLLSAFLILPIWLNTYYVLANTELLVKCGIWKPTRISYDSIRSVKETRNPLASCALSLDRIEITFGVGGIVFISPQNKQEFLQQLEQRRV